MKRILLLLAVPAVPTLAEAAPTGHRVVVTSFDRVRVDGPFAVELTTRSSPSAGIEASAEVADMISVRVEGTTLIVAAGPRGAGAIPRSAADPAPIIHLATQTLRSATVIGGGKLTVIGTLSAPRIDLQVTGSGAMSVPGLDTDQLNATLLGSGAMTLGGRSGKVRLLGSGSGVLDASALRGDDVTVRLDGSGSISGTARYTADATSTGVGTIAISGKPACRIKALAGGPIACGTTAPVK